MALFRKFFSRKPPEGLLEITERVYVFKCCFAIDVLGDEEFRDYVGGVVAQLRDSCPDASFLVFNFQDGENHSHIADVLSEYDITVMDYPRQYENCPLLTMEMIHHFLKSSDSWLAPGLRNVLLLHCERGGWPVLAFMLAALLIYRKQYTAEQRTLDMIYKQATREFLPSMLPLNPLPSQLRYLQYVSRRNLGSEWSPLVRAVRLDCIILRFIPNMDGEGVFRPIFRIHGPDPFMAADQTPKVLFSTPKRSKVVQHYKQEDSELAKIDINCHIQGDVVIECITIDHDLQLEEIMFRIMFNTAFIRSNILILNRDEIDSLWNVQDQFSRDFRAEVLFSEMDSSSHILLDLPVIEDKGGPPIEAFNKAQDMSRNVDLLDQRADVEQNMVQIQENFESVHAAEKENLVFSCSQIARIEIVESCSPKVAKEVKGSVTLPTTRNEKLDSVRVEAFDKVPEMFSGVDGLDLKTDVTLNKLQITASKVPKEKQEAVFVAGEEIFYSSSPQSVKIEEKWEADSLQYAGNENLDSSSPQGIKDRSILRELCSGSLERPKSKALENDIRSSQPKVVEEQGVGSSISMDLHLRTKKIDSQELQAASQRPVQSKIVSPRILPGSLSNPDSFYNSLQGLPSSLSRYQSASSVLGITALLHDTSVNNKVGAHVVTLSPKSSLSASFPHLCKPVTPSFFSVVPPSELLPSPVALAKVSPTTSPSPPPPSASASSSLIPKAPSPLLTKSPPQSSTHKISAPKELDFAQKSISETLIQQCPQKSDSDKLMQDTGYSPSVSYPSLLSFPHSGMLVSSTTNNSFTPPPPPPPLLSKTTASLSVKNSYTSPLLPPPLLPSSASSSLVAEDDIKNSSSIPHPLPNIAPSSGPVHSLLPARSSKIGTSPFMAPPPNIHSLSYSTITTISSAEPTPSLSLTASSSSQTQSCTSKYSSLTTPLMPPLPGTASSTGLISLIVPEKYLGNVSPPPPPPPPLHLRSLSSAARTSSERPPAPLSPPLHSIREALSPTENSSSALQELPQAASSSGTISSLLPEKSCIIAARSPPPPPPPPTTYSRELSKPAPSTPTRTHIRSLCSAAATSSEPPPAPPPPPSYSSREALYPTKNSSSTPPTLPGAASSSGPISSLLPEKSCITASISPPPPSLPLQSRELSNLSASSASAPAPVPEPPPPPPSSRPKESMAKISPHIPPPPAPFSNALPKAGASSLSNSSSRNGNILPTPALPLGSKGRLQSSSTAKHQSQTKKTSLKPYHWLKLTRAMQGSLWAEALKPEEASKTPEFDMSELESLFSATVPNSDHGSTRGKSSRASRSKSDKVNLIDLRRAYNCEIMLTKVKIPLPDLMSSVLALDDSALDADQVDNLIKFCPTKEEMELLKNYNGDRENLGKCEQFFLELMKVPRADLKLRVFAFKMQFSSQVSDLRNALDIVNSSSEEVRNSVKLKRIMQAILSLGNALNHGTARGSAVGFRLDSLLKLTDTRACNNKMTLMHYLCKVLAEKLPELLDFPKDLTSLESAMKIQLKYLAEEMQAISKGMEKVVQELTASENDGLVSESFCKKLKEFLCSAEAEVKSLASLYSLVGKNADALVHYFGEDPARCPFEQVISTLLNFVRMFVRAHAENCKQIEFEKKRAEKDAENEKTKLYASTMESDKTKSKTNASNVRKYSIQSR